MVVEAAFQSEHTYTQAEFWAWVHQRPHWDINRYELLGGRIVMSPPARPRHGVADVRIAAVLENFVYRRGLGHAFDGSVGYELPTGDTLQPDVSFLSRERLESAPERGEDQAMRAVPDLIVEVLSPSTRHRDIGEKRTSYEQSGVREYWIVDPHARSLTIYVARDGRFDAGTTFTSGEATSSILPGLAVALDYVFDFDDLD
jgi:Uma2 family endonuclease